MVRAGQSYRTVTKYTKCFPLGENVHGCFGRMIFYDRTVQDRPSTVFVLTFEDGYLSVRYRTVQSNRENVDFLCETKKSR